MPFQRRILAFGLAAGFAAAVTSTPAAAATTLTAEVASSVELPFKEFISEFEKANPGTTVSAKYLGGQVIQGDVDSGQALDIVVVGKSQTDKVTDKINTPVPILTNREVILVLKANPKHISGLNDLAAPGLRVALGTADAAVGNLARQVLKKANTDPAYGSDFGSKVRQNVTFEGTKGSDVVDAVASGKADAAIAFISDVDTSRYAGVKIPSSLNVDSVYYAFVPKAAKNTKAGQAMVDLMASPRGLAILRKDGYLSPAVGLANIQK